MLSHESLVGSPSSSIKSSYSNIVTVLAIGRLHNARRLARVLLADPLAPESAREKHLTDEDQDGRPILLR